MQPQKVKQLAEKLAADCDYSLLDLSKVIHRALVDANFHEEAVRLEHYFNARFNDRPSDAEAVDYLKSQGCAIDAFLSCDIVSNSENQGYKVTTEQAKEIASLVNAKIENDWSVGIQWEDFEGFIRQVGGTDLEEDEEEEETLEDFAGDIFTPEQ